MPACLAVPWRRELPSGAFGPQGEGQAPERRFGAFWCRMVYPEAMSNLEKPIRQSISLPPRVARRVKALARTKKTSANRVVVDLIEAGLEGQEQEKKRFFDLADRLVRSSNPEEEKRLKEELARMTFGE